MRRQETKVGRIKLVIVGDYACGKTSLLLAFSEGRPQLANQPTAIINVLEGQVVVDRQTVGLTLWDTADAQDLCQLRHMTYADADVIIVCCSIDKPESIDSIARKWLPELRLHCPQAAIVVVSNKKDLLSDPVTLSEYPSVNRYLKTFAEEGSGLAAEEGVQAFFECSSKEMTGVQAVFEGAARVALLRPRIKKRRSRGRCIIS